MEVFIRTFQPEDQHDVVTMFEAGINSYKNINDGVARVQANFAKEKMLNDMKDIFESYVKPINSTFLVAICNGEIAGCVGAFLVNNGTTLCCSEEKINCCSNVFELVRMSVASKYQRCGIGKKLLNAIETWARNHDGVKLVLSTLAVMDKARALYNSAEFSLVDTKSLSRDFLLKLGISINIDVCYYEKCL